MFEIKAAGELADGFHAGEDVMTRLRRSLMSLAILLGSTAHGLAQAQGPASQEVLLPDSIPPAPFGGVIREANRNSTPYWPHQVKAPAGAPNVLLVLTDDAGFGASGAFGGPIPTPNLDRLAAHGLKYNEFHTTALCSPTRASLLTGRNHHAVAMGYLSDQPEGYPGYQAEIPKSAATIGRVLEGYGYNTAWFGKHHNLPPWEQSAAGPFDHWPTRLGFEYFFGFIGGDENQWNPNLFRGTSRMERGMKDPTQTLDYELATDAIGWIHNQKAAAPDKPFFIYYAPGTTHAPHQAPADWIARFKGQFDQGWDKVRGETFARQKALGVIPADADLTVRPAQIPAWDSLSPEQKRAYARMMEVYAGTLAYEDAQVGRILDELQRMGQLDNTLVIFIEGDNGASGEGGPGGMINELGTLINGVHDTPAEVAAAMPEMGGAHTYENYPVGWAWAMDTPFQWTKQVASHLGGTRDGMVISWPSHIKADGGIRTQYSHVNDIYPTILDAIGVRAPTVVDGVRQQRLDGTSLVYTFDHPDAVSRHRTQYYEITANRGIYHDGWLANTTPRRMPWAEAPAGDDVTTYNWELYDLTHDYSQAHDLAASQPAKLRELQAMWMEEAKRNNVFPLDSRFTARAGDPGPQIGPRRTDFVYWGADTRVAQSVAPNLGGRSFTLTANVRIPSTGASGVVVATGSWFGGWSFYLQDGRPVVHESLSTKSQDQFQIEAHDPVPAGDAVLRYEFAADHVGADTGGEMRILVNGVEVASGRIERTIRGTAGIGETFDIGRDTGAPVVDAYSNEGWFQGEISKVEVTLDSR
jgi:arylsulfatase A-like enzyme